MVLVNVKDKPIERVLSLDSEWSMDKDKHQEHMILAAGFKDSNGMQLVYLLEDFMDKVDKSKSLESQRYEAEYGLLTKIVSMINKYEYSIGFYSTGVRIYSPEKHKKIGRDSDLIQLHRRLLRHNIPSIIEQGEFSKIPYIVGKHSHLDTYRLFANRVIKTSIFAGQYSANDLDTIANSIIGRGKYNGLSGEDFESVTNLDEKRKYVLEDAALVMDCISNNNYELLNIMNSIADLTSVSFRDVCNSKGASKIWTPILDRITLSALGEVEKLANDKTLDEKELNQLLNRFDMMLKYQQRPAFKRMEAEEESEAEEDDDDDDNDDPRYIGGWVLDPTPAEYYNAYVFDIASLYPSMVVVNNLSYETPNCLCCKDNPLAHIPAEILEEEEPNTISILTQPIENDSKRNWHICLKYPGVFAVKTTEYMEKRLEYKALSKDTSGTYTKLELEYFEAMSQAYKILLNSGYGLAGYKFFKYENLEMAECVTRFGRYTIKKVIEIASTMFGLDVIYSDTDSAFTISLNSALFDETNINLFIDTCRLQLNVTIERDKVCSRLVMVGKKNYVAIVDNELVVKGLAGKKSNRCLWVREAFSQMLKDYKNNINPCSKLREELEKLETGKLTNIKQRLLIRTNLNKNPEEYKVNVIQKQIGLQLDLEDGDTANYYFSDTGKYTFDPTEYSVKDYKDQLIHTVSPFLKVLGYNIQNDLKLPSESLRDMVLIENEKIRIAKENRLKENVLLEEDDNIKKLVSRSSKKKDIPVGQGLIQI